MASFHDLEVWQQSVSLVECVYKITDTFPKKEQFRLTDQLCRAVVSISSNIAEGSARKSTKDFMRYIAIALGSLAEVRTQIIIAERLGYIDRGHTDVFEGLSVPLGRKLQALYTSLDRKT